MTNIKCWNLEPGQCQRSAFVARMVPPNPSKASGRFYFVDGSYVDASDADGGIWAVENGAVQQALILQGYHRDVAL